MPNSHFMVWDTDGPRGPKTKRIPSHWVVQALEDIPFQHDQLYRIGRSAAHLKHLLGSKQATVDIFDIRGRKKTKKQLRSRSKTWDVI